jgi:hypothetical protein
MFVTKDNPNGTMKRPQFSIRKRTRTGTTVLDIITARHTNHNVTKQNDPHTEPGNPSSATQYDTDNSDDDSDDEGINPSKTDDQNDAIAHTLNDLLQEQLRPIREMINKLSKKVTRISERMDQEDAQTKSLTLLTLNINDKVEYLAEEHSRTDGAGEVPPVFDMPANIATKPTYANMVSKGTNLPPKTTTKAPAIPKALRTLTLPVQKTANIDLISIRDVINKSLKDARAPENAFVTHIDTNLRNNIVLHTERSCKAEALRPYIPTINNAINTIITDAPSVRIHEKWAKLMVHSVSLELFPDTPTGMSLLQEEIEKFNTCKLTSPPRYLTHPETRLNKRASTIVIALPSEAAAKPLQKGVDIHGKRHTTERFYTARPWDQCSNCQQHGHHHMRCKNDARCRYCAEPHKTTEHTCKEKTCREPAGKHCAATTTKCCLCGGGHRSSEPECAATTAIRKEYNIPTPTNRQPADPRPANITYSDENAMTDE